MSNRTRTNRPAPQTSTDRPTATYPAGHPRRLPEGWRVDPRPSRYLDPTDPRLAQADATPTTVFPTRSPIRPASPRVSTQPKPTDGREGHEQPHETPLQDMGRPGILRRPSMAWHPSLMQLAIGAAVVLIALVGLQRYAVAGMADASHRCHELAAQDWARAERECRGAESGTPAPASTEQAVPSPTMSGQTPMPEREQADARTGTQPDWVTEDTHAPYSKDDPAASPLDLPRCTTSPSTPLPCLATVSPDSHRVVVLEEDASLTALVRQ